METLRLLTLATAIIALIAWIAWMGRSASRLYAIPVILWLVNDILFLAARAASLPIDPATLNAWSLAIHMQAAITLAGAGIYAWLRNLTPRAEC